MCQNVTAAVKSGLESKVSASDPSTVVETVSMTFSVHKCSVLSHIHIHIYIPTIYRKDMTTSANANSNQLILIKCTDSSTILLKSQPDSNLSRGWMPFSSECNQEIIIKQKHYYQAVMTC